MPRSSFIYQDLVDYVQTIQKEVLDVIKYLENRWNTDVSTRNTIRSRIVTIVDTNDMRHSDSYMNHELLREVFAKYTKNYVPGYLKKWIKIGIMRDDDILPFSDDERRLTVSEYQGDLDFAAYSEISVWFVFDSDLSLKLNVLPTDDIKTVNMRLQKVEGFPPLEMRLVTLNQNSTPTKKDWENSRPLESSETIFSCKLYESNKIILAKELEVKAYCTCLYF